MIKNSYFGDVGLRRFDNLSLWNKVTTDRLEVENTNKLITCTRSNTIRLEIVGSYNLDSFLSYESEQEFGFWGVVVMSHGMVRR